MAKKSKRNGRSGRNKTSTPKKTGRPSKFTPANCKIILEMVEVGAPALLAPTAAGVSYPTFREWIVQGEDDAAAGRKTALAEFSEQVKKAEARMVKSRLEIIKKAAKANGDRWQAAAWMLERRFPQLFSLTQRHEHSGPEGGAIPVKRTVDRIEELTEKFLARLDEGTKGKAGRRVSGNGH